MKINTVIGLCYGSVLMILSYGTYYSINNEANKGRFASGILLGTAISVVVSGVFNDFKQTKHDKELDELLERHNALRDKHFNLKDTSEAERKDTQKYIEELQKTSPKYQLEELKKCEVALKHAQETYDAKVQHIENLKNNF